MIKTSDKGLSEQPEKKPLQECYKCHKKIVHPERDNLICIDCLTLEVYGILVRIEKLEKQK